MRRDENIGRGEKDNDATSKKDEAKEKNVMEQEAGNLYDKKKEKKSERREGVKNMGRGDKDEDKEEEKNHSNFWIPRTCYIMF